MLFILPKTPSIRHQRTTAATGLHPSLVPPHTTLTSVSISRLWTEGSTISSGTFWASKGVAAGVTLSKVVSSGIKKYVTSWGEYPLLAFITQRASHASSGYYSCLDRSIETWNISCQKGTEDCVASSVSFFFKRKTLWYLCVWIVISQFLLDLACV